MVGELSGQTDRDQAVFYSKMKPFRSKSTSEQLAAYLREEILSQRLSGTMPGVKTLVKRLGVNSRALSDAMKELEGQGLLVNRGSRRQRMIVLPEDHTPPLLSIQILLYEPYDKQVDYLLDLQHRLRELGHAATIAAKNQMDFGTDAGKLERFVRQTKADAWIVMSGSRQILEWFATNEVPAFAVFGRMHGLPIAGARLGKLEALEKAVRRLHELGHRRMVMLCHEDRRKPEPGPYERHFLELLETLGIATGPYNLPDWPEEVEGFHRMLESIFMHTPPTALLTDTPSLFNAAHQFLARRKLRVPEDVSLLCGDPDPSFEWCSPRVTHIRWDPDPVIRNVIRWARNLGMGKADIRQRVTPVEFIEGGTIGKAP